MKVSFIDKSREFTSMAVWTKPLLHAKKKKIGGNRKERAET